MNKKIKVIDLLEMFYKKEKMPQKIKVSCYEFEYNEEINAYFNLDKNSNSQSLVQDWLNNASKLHNEVEILEDNTGEIEELDMEKVRKSIWTYTDVQKNKSNLYCLSLSIHHDILPKINELVKAVNKLRKEKE